MKFWNSNGSPLNLSISTLGIDMTFIKSDKSYEVLESETILGLSTATLPLGFSRALIHCKASRILQLYVSCASQTTPHSQSERPRKQVNHCIHHVQSQASQTQPVHHQVYPLPTPDYLLPCAAAACLTYGSLQPCNVLGRPWPLLRLPWWRLVTTMEAPTMKATTTKSRTFHCSAQRSKDDGDGVMMRWFYFPADLQRISRISTRYGG